MKLEVYPILCMDIGGCHSAHEFVQLFISHLYLPGYFQSGQQLTASTMQIIPVQSRSIYNIRIYLVKYA
jgi:hypothetical protein